MNAVYILEGARTPFAVWAYGKTGWGGPGGALREVDAYDLGAAAVKGVLSRAGLRADRVDRVVFSQMYYAGAHGCYGPRYVGLRSGVRPEVPCLGVGFACGSGLHAVIAAAQDVALGEAHLVAAGGSDNISQLRRDVFIPSFTDLACSSPIGKTVEGLAREHGISRQAQDRWALRSHRLAVEAQKAGRLAEEIVPVGQALADDGILPEPDPTHFMSAPPSFGEGGTVTKANTHALVDGGSAVLVGSEKTLLSWGRRPLGRFVAGAFAAVVPQRMGVVSVPAIRQALRRANLSIKDIDLFEINETFAAQVLIDISELRIPEEKVNPNGGALALGHPFAATGGRLVIGLLQELGRRGLKRGVASISAGGGQGVAVVVDRV